MLGAFILVTILATFFLCSINGMSESELSELSSYYVNSIINLMVVICVFFVFFKVREWFVSRSSREDKK